MPRYFSISTLFLGTLISGCATIPKADDGQVAFEIANRIDAEVEWRQGCEKNNEIFSFIQCAMTQELTPDSAIQIALLNNPKIQAFFEEIGMAQADLVEAGLLSNPMYEIEIRYPHIKGVKTNIEYLLTTSLLDVFLIPLRTKLASTEFEQAKLVVSNEVLDLAFEVRETYYELVSETQKIKYIRSSVELTGIIFDIASKQVAVGNINFLEFQLAQSRLLEAQIELAEAETEIIRLNEKLRRLLGFECEVSFLLPDNFLKEQAPIGFDLCTLEDLALRERLDLQVARFELIRISQKLGLKEWWTYTNLSGGLAGEREPEGENLLGIGIAGEIPIFNYGQAARMRLFAEFRQACNRLDDLVIHVRSEVREAHRVLTRYLKIIDDYENHLLPLQGSILDTSEAFYNVMGLGVDKLLENKYMEITALKNYTEAMKNYLISKVELDRSLGGNLFELVNNL